MGHLVNPISFRLGKTFFWNFVWSSFLKKNYKYLALQDLQFIVFFKWLLSLNFLYKLGLLFSHFKIFRLRNKLVFVVFFIYKKNLGFLQDLFKFSKKSNKSKSNLFFNEFSVKKSYKKKFILKKWEYSLYLNINRFLKKKKFIYFFFKKLKEKFFFFFDRILFFSEELKFLEKNKKFFFNFIFKCFYRFYFIFSQTKKNFFFFKKGVNFLIIKFKKLQLSKLFLIKKKKQQNFFSFTKNSFFENIRYFDTFFFLFFFKYKKFFKLKFHYFKNQIFFFKKFFCLNIPNLDFYEFLQKILYFSLNNLFIQKFVYEKTIFLNKKLFFFSFNKNLVKIKNFSSLETKFQKFLHKIYALLFENRILFLFEFFFVKSYEYLFFLAKHKFLVYSYVLNGMGFSQSLAFSNSNLISRLLFEALRFKKFNIKKAISSIVKFLYKVSNLKGYRIAIAGRLTRSRRGLYLVFKEGTVPLSTIGIPIDYSSILFKSKFGICGIKVWLNKEIFSASFENEIYFFGINSFFKKYKKKFGYLYHKNLTVFRYIYNLEKSFNSVYQKDKILKNKFFVSKKIGFFKFIKKNQKLIIKPFYQKLI